MKKKLIKILACSIIATLMFSTVSFAKDVKSFYFYITSLNYGSTPASMKAITSAPAVINTRASDGGYVQDWHNLDAFIYNADDVYRGGKSNFASNTRTLLSYDGNQQAGYNYHLHVYLTGYSITDSHLAYGTWAADDN